MTTTSPLAPTQMTYLDQFKPTTLGVASPTILRAEAVEAPATESSTGLTDTQAGTYSYILFPVSLPTNASVESAQLKFTTYSPTWNGASRAIQLYAITQSWSPTGIKWTTRPSVRTSDPITGNIPLPATAEQIVTVDVTPHIVQATTGTAWFGWMIRSVDANLDRFYGKGTKQPTLTITYNIGHKKPTNPRPGSGTENAYVATDQPDLYLDTNIFIGGHTSDSMRVQLSNTNTRNASGSFTSVAWDSGERDTTDGVMILSNISGAPTASEGTGYYWIGQLKGTDGKWSPWSDPVKWIYRAHGTLAITNPADAPLNYVEDSTPPLAWTLTGRTQTRYQYVIYDALTNQAITSSQVFMDSDNSITPANNIVTQTNKDYEFEIRTWDEYATQRQPATRNYVTQPVFASALRTFTYQLASGVTPVSNLTVINYNPKPYVRLEWERPTEPDAFEIVRNGIVIATNVTGTDAHKVGTEYWWQDYFPTPAIPLIYEIRAIVNNQTSSSNPTVQTYNDSPLGWLADLENDIFIAISGETPVNPVLTEVGATHQPLNSEFDVRIVSSLHGYSGTVEGGLCGECIGDGTTSEDLQQEILAIRDQPGKRLHLSIGNISIPVVIFDVTTAPRYGPAFGNLYTVSFNWHEVE